MGTRKYYNEKIIANLTNDNEKNSNHIKHLGNPGASSCNRNIAEKKGWTVLDEEINWAME